MDRRDTHASADRRDPRDARDRRGASSKRKRKNHGRGFKAVMTVVLILVITMVMLLCMAAIYIKNVIIPEASLEMADFNPNLTSTMYYKDPDTGNYEVMQTLYGSENRVWVDLSEIPKNLQNAAVAIEDKRFYDHNGVDWVRTAKAILLMFTGGDIQGGSTITQQLIKNMTDDDEVTVKRKVMEIFRALEFEKNYSKEEILEAYLNYISLGQGCNGVYTAAYTYFGKHVSELSLAECASLIAITNSPSKYDPLSKREITDAETGETKTTAQYNKERQELILQAMLEQGMISQEEYDQAVAEELVFNTSGDDGESESTQTTSTVYSWYEDQVINDVIDDLVATYGWSETYAQDMVFSGGLEIYTCMNPDVQAAVDSVYQDQSNLNYTSSSGQQLQSAITIVDNSTGEVVAMAGGMGEKTVSRGLNRATGSLRPPGSSIKPLSVYAPAIELNLVTPLTVVEDSPHSQVDGRDWPVNAIGVYKGDMTVSQAVKESTNTVAVKVLDMVGAETSFNFMQDKFHIELVRSLTKNNTTYTDINLASLALGGLTQGVSTYDMAAAYSTFARQGTYIEPKTYTMVTDSNRQVLLRNESEEETILAERTTYYITEMLQQVVTGGSGATGKAANFSGQEIAGKTGTTTSRRDLWFVGYTPYYCAAVWTGYPKTNEKISASGNPAITMWKPVMQKIHEHLENKSFAKPASGLEQVTVCADSGLRCTDACLSDIRGSRAVQVTVAAGTAPTESCNLHTFVDYCTEGKCVATDSCPSSAVKQVGVLDFERTEYFKADGTRYASIATDSAKNPDKMFHLIEMKRAIGLEPTPTASGGETYPEVIGCPAHAGMTPVDPDHPGGGVDDPNDPNYSPSVDDPSGGFGDANLPDDPTGGIVIPSEPPAPEDPSGGFGDAGMWAANLFNRN